MKKEEKIIIFTDKNKNQALSWAQEHQQCILHSWNNENKPIIVVPTPCGEQICEFGDALKLKENIEESHEWWKIEVVKTKLLKNI